MTYIKVHLSRPPPKIFTLATRLPKPVYLYTYDEVVTKNGGMDFVVFGWRIHESWSTVVDVIDLQ